MRDLCKANCGMSGGLLGAHAGRSFDVEVESAFDAYAAPLEIDDRTMPRVGAASIRVVRDSANGIRWKRNLLQRRRCNLLIQIDPYERQIAA